MDHILDLQAMADDRQEEVDNPLSTNSFGLCISCLSVYMCG